MRRSLVGLGGIDKYSTTIYIYTYFEIIAKLLNTYYIQDFKGAGPMSLYVVFPVPLSCHFKVPLIYHAYGPSNDNFRLFDLLLPRLT